MESQGDTWNTRCFKLRFLALAVAAFGLQVIGYVTPGLEVVDIVYSNLTSDESRISGAVWYAVECRNGGNCEPYPLVTQEVKSMQALTTLALAFTIATIVMVFIERRRPSINSWRLKMGASFTGLLSGILSLVSSGRRFSYALSYDEFEGPSQSYIEFPYSAFFFCLAGIVICIVTFLLVLDVLLDIQKEQTKLAPRLGLELPQVTPA